MTDLKNVAVFMDYENVHLCLMEGTNKIIDLDHFNAFREVGRKYGNVKRIKSFASWDHFRPQQQAFNDSSIDAIPSFSGLKNAVDIHLTVECLNTVFKEKIDVVVIFSGDGGYAPLVKSLVEEHDVEVYVYSTKHGANTRAYNWLGDKHLFIDNELEEVLKDKNELDPYIVKMIKVLHDAYSVKKMSFVSAGYFVNHLKGREDFSEVKERISYLLGDATRLSLILEKDRDAQSGNKMTSLEVNYEHPEVQNLSLKRTN